MKKLIYTINACCLLGCLMLTGCGTETTPVSSVPPESAAQTTAVAQADTIDYLVLVNKENPLPENWENVVETIHMTNSLGDDVEVEKTAYDAYLELKAALEKEGVFVDLDSARRSIAEQQRIVDDFTETYGELYVQNYVAVPGYSEHHTGLALDLYLNIDGEDVYLNEDMVTYPDIWAKIHAKLADYGFILRYLDGKESITGYGYEPWHIRYVKDTAIAKEITEKGITLEEYLNRLPVTDVTPPTEAEDSADAITIGIHTDGMGQFAVAEEGETPEFDPDFPSQDSILHLSEPKKYVLVAKADDGAKFVKWQKDGDDYSTDAEITVEFSENADYTAFFENE